MKQNVYNQPYNNHHHHHHQSNSSNSSAASSSSNNSSNNSSNPSAVNPPNYSSALKNNNNNISSSNNTNSSSGGPRGGPQIQQQQQQNKPHAGGGSGGYNSHRGNPTNQNNHAGPQTVSYAGAYPQQQSANSNNVTTTGGGGVPPTGHYENQQFNYSQQSYGGAGKQPPGNGQQQQFNQQQHQGYNNKPTTSSSDSGPYYNNKGSQQQQPHKQMHVNMPPSNLAGQQQHAQSVATTATTTAAVNVASSSSIANSEPTTVFTKHQASVVEETSSHVKAAAAPPVVIVATEASSEIVEKMSSMQIEPKPIVDGVVVVDKKGDQANDSFTHPEKVDSQQSAVSTTVTEGEILPSRLCEVAGLSEESGADNSDYYRNLVVAVDRLYPEAKFPLHDTWTFGYIKNDPTATRWEMNIKEIIDIAYVEDFWSVMSHCPTASQLSHLGDLTFFKKGIRPMWEDAENKQGGSWLHQVSNSGGGGGSFPNKRPFTMDVDDYWIETLLALIGDNFSANNHLVTGGDPNHSDSSHTSGNISGLFLSHRGKGWKLALWTKNYRDEKTTRLIGKMWKHFLKLNDSATITFEAHESKHNKNASNKIVYKE